MKFEHETYGALCHMSTFVINGIKADESDFGNQGDIDPFNAEDYGCGNMQFTRIEAHPDVLKKYNITKEEYSEVCDVLEEELSFGACGWCV